MADGGPFRQAAWIRAQLSLTVLSIDPAGLGGLWLRARASPLRDTFLAGLKRLALPLRKVPPDISDAALYGGFDLGALLGTGHARETRGVLGGGDALVLTMAECCPPHLAALLGREVDSGRHPVIALDEGAAPAATAPESLTDRLGLFVALDGIRGVVGHMAYPDGTALDAARSRVSQVRISDDRIWRLVGVADALGIGSLRAPLQAVSAARALAALDARVEAEDADLEMAAELVYAHRAGPPEESPVTDTRGRETESVTAA